MLQFPQVETMRHLPRLVLPLALLTTCGHERVGARTVDASRPGAARADPYWVAAVTARIRDGSHQFFPDRGQLRAEVPERGLTGRFDEAGAHLGSVDPNGTPIQLHTTTLGRAGSNSAVLATAPGLGDCQEGKADPEGRCIPRLEFASAGLTEWWEAGTGGFEQGWVLADRPDGEGPVQIAVEVGNADVTVGDGTVSLLGDDGSTMRVSGLRAWDARGDDVPARFESDEDGFRVVVDDAGAAYPVVVDPVYTNADWIVEGGVGGYGDAFGVTVAGAGDTNGDGFDDVLVGSSSSTWLFAGSSTGVETVARYTLSVASSMAPAGDVNGDGFDDVVIGTGVYLGAAGGLSTTPSTTVGGGAVSAGDVNGDGYGDVVWGSEWQYDPPDPDYFYRGRVYLGSAAGLAPTPMDLDPAGLNCDGVSEDYDMEGDAAGAGDVNGDGFDDVILADACFAYSSYPYGTASIYYGSASGPASTGVRVARQDGLALGVAVASAGDIDGDGYDDVLVGAPWAWNGAASGRVYVYAGSASGTATTASTVLEADSSDLLFGSELAGAGDLNADGYADIVVGADVYLGSSAGLITTAVATLAGSGVGAGDTNGDGYDDVIAGDPEFNSTTPDGGYGAAWVYRGSSSATMEDATLLAGRGEHLGVSIANAGDINGDGYDDLIVGADGYLDSTGEALIYRGSATGFDSTASSTLIGASAGAYFGRSVAGAGDTNNDGYDDVVIGAWGSSEYGAAYTFNGSGTGELATPDTTISGDSATAALGYYVAGIGDVNGDGYDDVAVATSSGANFVGIYVGSSSGTSATAATQLNLPYALSALATAGDVNGDLYDDLVIGCEEYSTNTGVAYVYNGSPAGTVGSVSATLAGENSEDHFGASVAGAGDVNGDGYGDVVVGAYGSDGDLGRIYVYNGASTGLSRSAASLDGAIGRDHLGAWVAPAGDVNADGYDDVRVAATGYGSTGALYVYAGSASGITDTVAARITGLESPGTAHTTGDFNGDGLVDVVVGDSSQVGGAGRASGHYGCVDADGDGYCEDEDCDETDPSVPYAVYADTDADGFGDPGVGLDVCSAVAGYVSDGRDCDDASAWSYPGHPEVCDTLDNDCDGGIDNDAIDQTVWYVDADGDGYSGSSGEHLADCDEPDGYSAQSAEPDCDDTDGLVHPRAFDDCNYVDDDCDGEVDEDADVPIWYADSDEDRFTDAAVSVTDCYAPDGYTGQSREPDCDDSREDVNPDATEVCDDLDNDCDGAIDTNAADANVWYPDFDNDEFVASEPVETRCTAPDGYGAVTDSFDCDDADPDIYPGAGDPPGDGIDQNCNGRDTIKQKACGCATLPDDVPGVALILLGAVFARRRGPCRTSGARPKASRL